MNSVEREREEGKTKGKNRVLVSVQLGSDFVQKGCGSGLATSPLSCLIKINPLGRIAPSVRADLSSFRLFRPTLTGE